MEREEHEGLREHRGMTAAEQPRLRRAAQTSCVLGVLEGLLPGEVASDVTVHSLPNAEVDCIA